MSNNKKKDISIVVNIVFVALFIVACVFVYKIFGLKNIKNAVERNGGMMHIDKTDYFTVDILFSNIYSKE